MILLHSQSAAVLSDKCQSRAHAMAVADAHPLRSRRLEAELRAPTACARTARPRARALRRPRRGGAGPHRGSSVQLNLERLV